MINSSTLLTLLVSAILFSTTVSSDDKFEHGGDVYYSTDDVAITSDAERDAFVVGYSVEMRGDVVQDAHAAGFNVMVEGDVGGNLYAVGSNIKVDGEVGKDLTASGFTINLNSDARILGNTRIAAGTVVIDAPIAGSLLVTAGTVKLNDSVEGDVRMTASDIEFGDDAVISGSLSYYAAEEISIPSTVISSDRVSFTRIKQSNTLREIRDTVDESVPDLWPATLATWMTGLVGLLAFLIIVSAVFLAFMPEAVERLKSRATEHAWRSIFYGFIGLSTLFGVIPVSAISIVGIPLIPIGILALIVVWTLGYLLGVYVIADRVWHSSDSAPKTVFVKLLVLSSGLIAMTIVNFIPFVGWLVNLVVVLFGVGAMTYIVMERFVRGHETAQAKTLSGADNKVADE